MAIQLRVSLVEFLDLQELVHAYSREDLARFAGGPINLHRFDPPRPSDADVLLQGGRAKGAAGCHMLVDTPGLALLIMKGESYSRSDGRTIGFNANQLEIDPIVPRVGFLNSAL
jgi:hypothetical protein